eukprot:Gb_10722 [translate_table: standard]
MDFDGSAEEWRKRLSLYRMHTMQFWRHWLHILPRLKRQAMAESGRFRISRRNTIF